MKPGSGSEALYDIQYTSKAYPTGH